MAQFGSALALGARGREFKSLHPDVTRNELNYLTMRGCLMTALAPFYGEKILPNRNLDHILDALLKEFAMLYTKGYKVDLTNIKQIVVTYDDEGDFD